MKDPVADGAPEVRTQFAFHSFRPGEMRFSRLVLTGDNTASLDLLAEQPDGAFFNTLRPHIIPEEEVKYWQAVAAQRKEQDET